MTSSRPRSPDPQNPLFDPAALDILIAELDREVVRGLAEAFVADMRKRAAACAAAAHGGDIAGVLDQAHALKATASTYGAMALHRAVLAIEAAGRGGDAQGCLALAGRLPALVEPTAAALDRWLGDGPG